MARTVNIGAQDFEKLIKNNYFYVDKTDFIKEWWENGDDVTLITRPRRFGKTLTMSMLNCFFSVQYAGRSDLFEGLSIWKEEKYRKLQGTYPVIFLSFADIKEDCFEDAREGIMQELLNIYNSYSFLLNSDKISDNEKNVFSKVCDNMSDVTAARSLKQLSSLLYKYYGKKPIILLDEYDAPMQEAYLKGYWKEMVEFTRGLFNSTFKSNWDLERGIMTGITRVSKESIFSDLNNLAVITCTTPLYETSFGFTEKEVFAALAEFSLQTEKQEVKRWYDGFRFGDHENIYNPWSIISYLKYKEFKPYWVNTSSNALVGALIQKGSKAVKIAMEDLLNGNAYEISLDEEIVFQDLKKKKSAIWSLLLASGYLKVVGFGTNKKGEPAHILKITNEEVMGMFKTVFTDWFSAEEHDTVEYNDFESALLSSNLMEMNVYMNTILLETVSYFDTRSTVLGRTTPENFYHGFVLGLTASLRKIYIITSNRESGTGRYDVVLKPRNPATYNGIILEFKVIDKNTEKNLKDTVNAALQQIIARKYAVSMEAEGIDRSKIRIYGFAFSGKEVLIDGGYIDDIENSYQTAESKFGPIGKLNAF